METFTVHLFAKYKRNLRETMGQVMAKITPEILAKEERVTVDRIRQRWNENYAKGTFDRFAELSPEQVSVLSRKKRGEKKITPPKTEKRAPRNWTPESDPNGKAFREALPAIQKEFQDETITVNQPAPASEVMPPAPERAKFEWPAFAQIRFWVFGLLAVAIVCGHGFLIWQEAAELYGYIGNIGGAVIFAVVCLAVLIASDSSRNRTSLFALWFMLTVDAAAGFVHYEALHTVSVPKAMTIGFCIFICASSFVALLLYRDSKLD